jgi:putative ABC transport system permease protein
MLLNYIKLSLRLLARSPFFSVLNIAGLSVGFAVFFVLWQYSSSELKSDRQWKDWKRIARVGILWQWSDHGDVWESERYSVIAGELGPNLTSDFPEVNSYTRILNQANFNKQAAGLVPDIVMSYQDPDGSHVAFRQEGIAMADPNFLTFFTIPLLAGAPSTALTNSNSLVMSASVARKYFGSANPLGRIVTLNAQTFMVTGVFPDLPTNTHLNFDILLSNTATQMNNWMALTQRPIITTYIKTKSTPDWKALESKVNDPIVLDRYFSEALKFFTNTKIAVLIQPLPEVRFSHMWIGDQFASRSKNLLIIFQSIGLVVLLLAIVNYISLNASRMSKRLKEMGARKVSGAGVKDLTVQFLIESALVFVLSVALAFTIIQGTRTVLQEMVQIPLTTPSPATIVFFASIVAASVGITAGYPAYLFAVNRPQSLFAKKITRGESKFTPLATVQFSAAIVLTIWCFMIYNQISFVIARDLGFSKNNVIVIAPPTVRSNTFESDMHALTQSLGTIPQIDQITRCHTVMGDAVTAFLVRKPGPNIPVGLDTNGGVDESFLPFYDIPLLAGRNFLSSDRGNEIILSDGALSRLGFKSPVDAIGATIEVATEGQDDEAWMPATVVGVIKGYRLRPMLKFASDHNNKADGGIALTYKSHLLHRLAAEKTVIRVSSVDLDKTIRKISDAFNQLFPGNVFHWYFLDENISRHYQNEKILRNQVLVFTCITIGIACLGLLGMITNKVVEKTKEIGIRKVLGAQLYQVAHVLLNTTIKQVTLATVVGIPVAYYLTQRYLENFSDRVTVAWWHFTTPIMILIVIMSCTVASAVWKAANGNPVEALKCE